MATDQASFHTLEIFRVAHSDLGLLVVTSAQAVTATSFAHLLVSHDDRNKDAGYLQAVQLNEVGEVNVGLNLIARVGRNQDATLSRSARDRTQDVRLVCDSEHSLDR